MTIDTRNWRCAWVTACAAALMVACGGGDSSLPLETAASPQLNMASVPGRASSAVITWGDEPGSLPSDPEGSRGAGPKHTNNAYIVQLAEMPVTAYTGTLAGLPATRPGRGRKIDPTSPAVTRYLAHLASRHDTVLQSAGGGRKLYSYGYVFNGFAADLTAAQVEKLARAPGVLAVTKDEAFAMDTSSTPDFLGLSGPGGVWSASGATGENVIIGIVDGGIWPEHPSFSDRVGTSGRSQIGGKLDYRQVPGWHGRCVAGEDFAVTHCNQKLIGARYYNAGFGGNAGIDAAFPAEFNSPRDYDGHGSHVASTAAGNRGVAVTEAVAGLGAISGIAPRARIAAYKVCWGTGGCFSSDSVAAIDQAVADGVDVINFSISGTSTNFLAPVEIAFLYAADAGVFVAASAGNNGPGASTVAHPSPWITTVAASTHNREGQGTVVLGNSASYSGASTAVAVPSTALVDAAGAGLPAANAALAALCYGADDNGGAPLLDPAKVAGRIVLCDRGTTLLPAKSKAVKEAGGIGMVLVNTPVSVQTLVTEIHAVPTVHLAASDRPALKAYAGTAAPTALFNASVMVFTAPAPVTADFSSRGPLLAGGGDLLKPDLTAPGVSILAAVAPPGNGGNLFALFNGTSMSSPHVAGLAALLKQRFPAWSPMAIKSALMTTAGDVLTPANTANTTPTVIFAQGAGHVRPAAAMNPGLIFDSQMVDWIGFLCGTQLPASACAGAGIPVLAPADFNVPSVAVGNVLGLRKVTRRVTNVGGNHATYQATADMPGFLVSMNPPALTLAPGETRSFELTLTVGTVPMGAWAGGQLTLSDGAGHTVRLPLLARALTSVGAPAEVNGSFNVSFGYTGPFSAAARGLIPASTASGSVATDGTVDFDFVVPGGTTYARFALFDSEVSQPGDLDLHVIGPDQVVRKSEGGTSAEVVSLSGVGGFVPPGAYKVRVIGYAVPAGAVQFKLFSWFLGSANAGNMTVTAPASAVLGQTGSIVLATSGLAAGQKYLGSVAYAGVGTMPPPTIVRVDP